MLSMIVTVDRNWAISKDHKQLISIPEDVKFVRDITYGEVMIVGRHTFEHSYNGKVLPNRTTVIVTKEKNYEPAGAIVAHSAKEALKKAEETGRKIYVIGGKKLYEEYMPLCDEIHVTWVDYAYSADSFFPNLDKLPEWVLIDESEEQTHFDVVYYYRRYVRRKDYRA